MDEAMNDQRPVEEILEHTIERAGASLDRVTERLHDAGEAAKPRLRGWLHAVMLPLAAVAGVVLVILAPASYRWSAAIYAVSAVLLFGVSAVYHRGTWSPTTQLRLKRFDHANIFLIIAGSYTPLAVALLPTAQTRTLLLVVWMATAAGVLVRTFWPGAPRWLSTVAYLALGWVSVFYLPGFATGGGVAILVLIAAGGACYSVGGIVYALKRPNPSPTWFGFHEVFHALTLAGFILQYIAISMALYGAR